MSSTTSIRITRPLYGGGFASDRNGLIPFVLPGELVSVTETPRQILERSPDRVEPRCIHFGECGGCHYQHTIYPAQLSLKTEILLGIFTEAGLNELPSIQTNSAARMGISQSYSIADRAHDGRIPNRLQSPRLERISTHSHVPYRRAAAMESDGIPSDPGCRGPTGLRAGWKRFPRSSSSAARMSRVCRCDFFSATQLLPSANPGYSPQCVSACRQNCLSSRAPARSSTLN